MTPTRNKNAEASPISGCGGYWKQITPGVNPISTNGRPCDAVYVSVSGATVTGKRGAVGSSDLATASPPLAANFPHALSFYTITAVSSGNVWAVWYLNPDLT